MHAWLQVRQGQHLLQLQLQKGHQDLEHFAAPQISVSAGVKKVCDILTLNPENDSGERKTILQESYKCSVALQLAAYTMSHSVCLSYTVYAVGSLQTQYSTWSRSKKFVVKQQCKMQAATASSSLQRSRTS